MGVVLFHSNPHIFMLDNKEIVAKYQMSITDATAKFVKSEELPYLIW